jgi:hypothetical protein
VYGEHHHFTVCARQNLEYVRNKKKSVEERRQLKLQQQQQQQHQQQHQRGENGNNQGQDRLAGAEGVSWAPKGHPQPHTQSSETQPQAQAQNQRVLGFAV